MIAKTFLAGSFLFTLSFAVVPQGGLARLLSKIEQTKMASIDKRLPWYEKLCALATAKARKAALKLFESEHHVELRSMLLEHAMVLPDLDRTMLEELESGRSLPARIVAARYFIEGKGEEGVTLVKAILGENPEGLRHKAALLALARQEKPPATQAFVEIFQKESVSLRASLLPLLRGFKGEHIDQVRKLSMAASYTPLKGEAIYQLVVGGNIRALVRARRLAAGSKIKHLAPLLFEALAHKPKPQDLVLLARLVEKDDSSRMQSLYYRSLPELAAKKNVRQWATEVGLRIDKIGVKLFVLELLQHGDSPEDRKALLTLANDKTLMIRRKALALLCERKEVKVLPLLEKRLVKGRPEEKLDALEGMDLILGDDEKFLKRLEELALTASGTLKLLAVDLGSKRGIRALLQLVPVMLQKSDWPSRTAAIQIAARVRDKSSIPLLIRQLKRERGRLADDVNKALGSLTRLNFLRQAQWDKWWEKEKDGFLLPPPEEKKIVDKKPKSGTSAEFYGIPVVSRRVIYCLDVSGSMAAKVGTGSSRIVIARQALLNALKNGDRQSLVNIIFFDNKINHYARKMVPLKRKGELEKLSAFVKKAQPLGGTNIYAALRAALKDPRVDTIFLLSDGQPSTGDIVNPKDLGDYILRANRSRRIVFNCISVGEDSALLKRLAAASGGSYVRF